MIDAVYQTDDQRWVVLDYKTGARLAQLTDEALISEYEFQLGVYTLAIEQLIGCLPDSVGLAVVHDSVRIVEMKFDAMQLAQISDRISQAISHINQSLVATESC